MSAIKDSTEAATGVAVLFVMLLLKALMSFVGEFVFLVIVRFLYCFIASKTFSIWWPVHGAFFLAVVTTLLMVVNTSVKMVDGINNKFKKIPVKMIVVAVAVFLFQFVWHGVHCFFSKEPFLIADEAWLGDLLMGVFVAILYGIGSFIKCLFTKQ